jgi:terminase small subunit / prophage DNA-packing protein
MLILKDKASADELGALVGISARSIRDLAAAGTIPKAAERGRYPTGPALKAYALHLREAAAARGSGEALPALTSERMREARERADHLALKNAAMRGEMVPALEVERTWTGALRELRARFLAVPARVRQRLPHLTRTDVAALEREIRDALQEAADGA